MSHSTTRAKRPKPSKDFPLFHHASGRWAKKVRGKLVYFGKVSEDPKGIKAHDQWLKEKDYLTAGRKPPRRDGLTVADACDYFLTAKTRRLESGELTQRTFNRYYATCAYLVESFGKNRLAEDLDSDDFQVLRAKMAKRWGPTALSNEVQYVRSVFKHAWDNQLIDRPIRFGSEFIKPSKKTLRKQRAKRGKRLFTPEEIKAALSDAPVNVKAFVLLGINSGMGNTDIAEIKISQVDGTAWLDHVRSKTFIDRRIPLWEETRELLQDVLKKRREPKDSKDSELLFIGGRGGNYIGSRKGHAVYQATKKVFPSGRTFYDLRHTFETVAGGTKDQPAVDHIMGHVDDSMADTYRENIEDERLRVVADYVHAWLYPTEEESVGAV